VQRVTVGSLEPEWAVGEGLSQGVIDLTEPEPFVEGSSRDIIDLTEPEPSVAGVTDLMEPEVSISEEALMGIIDLMEG